MLLVIDNNTVFTSNLVSSFKHIDQTVCVFQNNKITLSEVTKLNPDYIVISPGPGRP